MKRRLVLLFLLATGPAAAQTDEVVRAALYLTGADSPEALDDRLIDELESFRSRPLPVNRASRARLLDSGLLTPYQVAALSEYRSLSGDVLSFAELERVDGFGKEAVAALRPFLSLESARGIRPPSRRSGPGHAYIPSFRPFPGNAQGCGREIPPHGREPGGGRGLEGAEWDFLWPLPAAEREDTHR